MMLLASWNILLLGTPQGPVIGPHDHLPIVLPILAHPLCLGFWDCMIKSTRAWGIKLIWTNWSLFLTIWNATPSRLPLTSTSPRILKEIWSKHRLLRRWNLKILLKQNTELVAAHRVFQDMIRGNPQSLVTDLPRLCWHQIPLNPLRRFFGHYVMLFLDYLVALWLPIRCQPRGTDWGFMVVWDLATEWPNTTQCGQTGGSPGNLSQVSRLWVPQ